MNVIVEIAHDSADWDKYPEFNSEYFAEIAVNILSKYPNFAKVAEFELSILLTNAVKMQSLNKEFRQKDKETNVLSFPDLDINWRRIVEFSVNPEYMYLGDVAFGFEVIAKEAELKSISLQHHFKHLVVHAILHLIGYDHVKEKEAEVMEALEIEILKSFGVDSPY